MKRLALALLPAVLVALAPAAPAAAGPGRSPLGEPVLLALGDSVAAGVGAVPKVTGYPEQLQDLLSTGYNTAADKATGRKGASLELRNLAVSGATTLSLVRDQLPAAIALIQQRSADRDPKNDVEVITVTIGGNDVFRPVIATCLSPMPAARALCQATTTAQIEQVRAGLVQTLSALAAAAGPRTEIVVTTYDNPVVGSCPLTAVPGAATVAAVVLQGGTIPGLLTLADGLNEVVAGAAASTGAQVADLYGRFAPSDLLGDCLHPSQAGHDRIAGLVAQTLAD